MRWRTSLFLLAIGPAAFAGQTFTVDDDGVDCPGALTTIQAAVEQAGAGDTVVVCRGTYLGSVTVTGHEKDGLQLVARQGDKVLIQGDHTEDNGIALMDVDGVLLRGFTVRDFGTMKATSPEGRGIGHDIVLRHANGNTVEKNDLATSDMIGILVLDSGKNIIRDNLIHENGTEGIHIEGTMPDGKEASTRNVVQRNRIYGNPLAGIVLFNAGVGNEITENNLNGNGRYGISNVSTDGTLIAANRAIRERGLFSFPDEPQVRFGIDIRESSGVSVVENLAVANSGAPGSFDLFWDGVGENAFESNGCRRSSPEELCVSDIGRPERPDRRP
jgi:parallel beta-helix repeat protein